MSNVPNPGRVRGLLFFSRKTHWVYLTGDPGSPRQPDCRLESLRITGTFYLRKRTPFQRTSDGIEESVFHRLDRWKEWTCLSGPLESFSSVRDLVKSVLVTPTPGTWLSNKLEGSTKTTSPSRPLVLGPPVITGNVHSVNCLFVFTSVPEVRPRCSRRGSHPCNFSVQRRGRGSVH